jgi:hypothetical protein
MIRSKPMGKRETAAIEAYYGAKDATVPAYVKGAGLGTTERLLARAYVEVWETRDDNRVSYHRITAAGAAEWQRIAGNAADRA